MFPNYYPSLRFFVELSLKLQDVHRAFFAGQTARRSITLVPPNFIHELSRSTANFEVSVLVDYLQKYNVQDRKSSFCLSSLNERGSHSHLLGLLLQLQNWLVFHIVNTNVSSPFVFSTGIIGIHGNLR